MKNRILFAVCIAAISALQACQKEEPAAPGESELLLQVKDYPAFKTIGVADPGKSAWENSDALYLVLQTAENPLAARYRITMTSDKWSKYEKYEAGEYTSVTKITVPGDCRALSYYAPDYAFDETEILKLNEGCSAGLNEYMQWNSGDQYDITAGSTITISFSKDYSRIRVAGESEGYTIKMQAAAFTPAGYNTAALGTKTLDCLTDANGNAFFYGTWTEGTTLQFKSYDKTGKYSTSETLSGKAASENGRSYAVSCKDTDFMTIAELVATSTTTATACTVKLKNVVVSYSIGQYTHLEDESGAILVYSKGSTSGLSEGQRINGTVTGTLQTYNGLPEIMSINYSQATVTSDGIVPQTELTIAQLLADFDANLSRRILIKGVSVVTGITEGASKSAERTGSISQNGSTLQVYATNTKSVPGLEAGLEGDIIVFPTYYKTTKQASFYSADHFTEGGSGEDTPFTRLTTMGCYSSTDTESPVAVRTYEEGADQFSCSKSSDSRSWNLFNLDEGTYLLIDFPASISVGSEVNATVNTDGNSQDQTLTVAKKAGSNAWLEDKTNHVGYVINLQ